MSFLFKGTPFMPSDQSSVDFVVDQMRDAGAVSYRKMFGKFTLYCNARVVALIWIISFF